MLTITLNRPDVLNALNAAMHVALAAALQQARDARCPGRCPHRRRPGFCVGQDLTEFGRRRRHRRAGSAPTYHPNVLAIRALEKPVHRRRQRAGRRGGPLARLRLRPPHRADAARFVPAFVGIGLVPDSGGSFFTSRLLGPRPRLRVVDVGRR